MFVLWWQSYEKSRAEQKILIIFMPRRSNFDIIDVKVTKKREKSERKVYFSFLFRVPVTSTVTNRLGSLHVRCPGVCKCRLGEVANIGSLAWQPPAHCLHKMRQLGLTNIIKNRSNIPFCHKIHSICCQNIKIPHHSGELKMQENHRNKGFAHLFWGLWEDKFTAFCDSWRLWHRRRDAVKIL